MLPKVLRRGFLVLGGLLLAAALLSDAAEARGGLYAAAGFRGAGLGPPRPAYWPAVVGLSIGYGYGYHGHPLDDSYDPPFGYGEYAEYGPWAQRGYAPGPCQLTQRRVWTAYGLRWRTVRVCD